MKLALAVMVASACSKASPTPIHELRFRGAAKVVAAAPGGGAVVAGEFAVETDLGAGELLAGDDRVHGVVARIDRDGRVVWDAVLPGPFVQGIAADGEDVLLVAAAGPENRAWRLGPGGGEQWSVSFGGATPRACAWSDDGTLYIAGNVGISDPTSGALGLVAAEGRTAWLAAIDRGGKVRWATMLDATRELRFAQGVVVSGGRVFVMSSVDHGLIVDVYDRAGTRIATRTVQVDGMNASIAPLGDGVVIAMPAGQLVALDHALATRWERRVGVGILAVASSAGGIFIGGSSAGAEWNGVTYPVPEDGKPDAIVARLSPDGEPDWIAVGRGRGAASTSAVAASGDAVWGVGAFDGPIVFGIADPLPGERDGIQSGFAIELKQTR